MKCSINGSSEIHVVAEGFDHCQCGNTTRSIIEYNYSPTQYQILADLLNEQIEVVAENSSIQPVVEITPSMIKEVLSKAKRK